MFYNTGIGTYIWVLSNKKEERRKGKIQLIDATGMKQPLRKNMGNKNCEFTPEIRKEIVRIFLTMEESDVSMIFDNDEFAYWNVSVERPLRLRIYPEREIPELTDKGKKLFAKQTELEDVRAAVVTAAKRAPLDDWDAFAQATGLKKGQLKKIRPYITETDPGAKVVEGETDKDLSDEENIPFKYEGGIDAFIENEVKPYAPDAFVDEVKTKIGYAISFTKYFYKPIELRSMTDILADFKALEQEADGVMDTIMEGLA
jgi:type I restriction enzyme M protein